MSVRDMKVKKGENAGELAQFDIKTASGNVSLLSAVRILIGSKGLFNIHTFNAPTRLQTRSESISNLYGSRYWFQTCNTNTNFQFSKTRISFGSNIIVP